MSVRDFLKLDVTIAGSGTTLTEDGGAHIATLLGGLLVCGSVGGEEVAAITSVLHVVLGGTAAGGWHLGGVANVLVLVATLAIEGGLGKGSLGVLTGGVAVDGTVAEGLEDSVVGGLVGGLESTRGSRGLLEGLTGGLSTADGIGLVAGEVVVVARVTSERGGLGSALLRLEGDGAVTGGVGNGVEGSLVGGGEVAGGSPAGHHLLGLADGGSAIGLTGLGGVVVTIRGLTSEGSHLGNSRAFVLATDADLAHAGTVVGGAALTGAGSHD